MHYCVQVDVAEVTAPLITGAHAHCSIRVLLKCKCAKGQPVAVGLIIQSLRMQTCALFLQPSTRLTKTVYTFLTSLSVVCNVRDAANGCVRIRLRDMQWC